MAVADQTLRWLCGLSTNRRFTVLLRFRARQTRRFLLEMTAICSSEMR
jgi:hypothetical protein